MPSKPQNPERECYCCLRPATTIEHVPPRCFFPEKKDLSEDQDFRKSLITVPSCVEHNTKKSGDDEYLHYVITMSLGANDKGHDHFITKILRAINRRPALINRLLSRSKPAFIKDPGNQEVFETWAIEVEYDRVENVLILLARGLYYHHFKIKCDDEIDLYAGFLVSSGHENSRHHNEALATMFHAANQIFEPLERHGENPDIFFYQVADAQPHFHKILQVTFFGGVKIVFLFGKQANPPLNSDPIYTGWFYVSWP